MIIQSLGALADMGTSAWYPSTNLRTVRLYDNHYYDYAALYRTQPNIRTCVDFLARNIAQLGLHVFERVSDTDRRRLTDDPLAVLLAKPNPWTTRYRLIESLMGDLGVYFNAYWFKGQDRGETYLLRIPPQLVTVSGSLVPRKYEIDLGGRILRPEPGEVIHFRGYNPDDATKGLSPLETLRRILAEEHSMGDYREHFWQNSARMSGVIERPKDAPEWSPTARERFKSEFEALYSGGENSGKTAILEEGMTWKEAMFNAQESEYMAGRKLTREECARAYHIPLPMVGILEHATYSNITEQHRNLYQDSIGPWLAMIEQEIDLQLLSVSEGEDVYVEFNIAEKMQGSFEEQIKALQSAVGRPWMTANEARARQNMPQLGGDADLLVTPLNVLVGGQASPLDSAPPEKALTSGQSKAAPGQIDPTLPELRARHEEKWLQVIRRVFERQLASVVGLVAARSAIQEIWDEARWNRELTADMFLMNVATATAWARYVAKELGLELDEDRMLPWLEENARIAAEEINSVTMNQVTDAMSEEDPVFAVKHLFGVAIGVRAMQISTSKVTTASVFGSQDAARQGGLRTKTWIVNSGNPRPEHAAMNGVTIGIGELFPTGQRWPGDPAGGAENNANCRCSVTFGR